MGNFSAKRMEVGVKQMGFALERKLAVASGTLPFPVRKSLSKRFANTSQRKISQICQNSAAKRLNSYEPASSKKRAKSEVSVCGIILQTNIENIPQKQREALGEWNSLVSIDGR